MVFEKFDRNVQRSVALARAEATQLNHDHIGTEHLLIGLVHHGDNVGAQVLASYGVTLDGIRQAAIALIGLGTAPTDPAKIPFGQDSKDTILRAAAGQDIGEGAIDSGDLLVALIDGAQGHGNDLIAAATNVGAEQVRQRVRDIKKNIKANINGDEETDAAALLAQLREHAAREASMAEASADQSVEANNEPRMEAERASARAYGDIVALIDRLAPGLGRR